MDAETSCATTTAEDEPRTQTGSELEEQAPPSYRSATATLQLDAGRLLATTCPNGQQQQQHLKALLSANKPQSFSATPDSVSGSNSFVQAPPSATSNSISNGTNGNYYCYYNNNNNKRQTQQTNNPTRVVRSSISASKLTWPNSSSNLVGQNGQNASGSTLASATSRAAVGQSLANHPPLATIGHGGQPQMIPLAGAAAALVPVTIEQRQLESEVAQGQDNNQYRAAWLHPAAMATASAAVAQPPASSGPVSSPSCRAPPINHGVISSSMMVGRPPSSNIGASAMAMAPSSQPTNQCYRLQAGSEAISRPGVAATAVWGAPLASEPSSYARQSSTISISRPQSGNGSNRTRRRRHRSCSGAATAASSPTPPAAGRNYAASATNQQTHARHSRRSSHRARSPNSGRQGLARAHSGPKSRLEAPTGSVKAISAHCWLIDSSDELASSSAPMPPQLRPQTSSLGPESRLSAAHQHRGHITVAMMRQAERKQQRQQQQQQQLQHQHRAPSLPNHQLRAAHLSPVYQDLSMSLKNNSLKMERILDRQQRQASTLPGGHRSRSAPSRGRSEGASSQHNIQTLARLSALLSMVSRLVSSGGGSNQVKQAARSEQSVQLESASYKATSSLGVSSSSSTSAYVTESSAGTNNSRLTQLDLAAYSSAAGQVRPMQASLAGSMHYSTGSNANQAHSYQYCDQALAETEFNCSDSNSSSSPSSKSSSSNPSSSGSCTLPPRHIESAANMDEPRMNLQTILSDHELISAGPATSNFRPGSRWRWISLRELARRPRNIMAAASSSQDDEHLEGHQREQMPLAQQYQSRYKSLPPAAGNQAGWHNLCSLAKADRVFRNRLIASLIVSGLFVALLSLSSAIIYLRLSQTDGSLANGRPNGGKNNARQQVAGGGAELSLLIHSSDHDLSWLYPAPPSTHLGAALTKEAASPTRRKQTDQSEQWDALLRANLLQIEQSQRLKQLHQTVVHLTSLQLAQDTFVDLSALGGQLYGRQNESNPSSNNLAHSDLLAVCLLANLNWPLVKWRHQSQQSAQSFLAGISLTASKQEEQTVWTEWQQTLQNLLSLLMLADSAPPKVRANNQMLAQLGLLSHQLWRISSHLSACSIATNLPLPSSTGSSGLSLHQQLSDRLCKLLEARYRRLMLRLSQLDHSQLALLNEGQLELAGQPVLGHSLVGFMLDRLALLDIDLLAESLLVEATERAHLAGWQSNSDSEWQQLYNELFDWLSSKPTIAAVMMELEHDRGNSWPQNADHLSGDHFDLLDLSKSEVGQNSAKLNTKVWPHLEETRLNEIELDAATMQNDLLFPWQSANLPLFARPLSYDLFLHPNLTSRFVLGMVKIEFKLQRATRYIVLNVAKLDLVDLTVWLKEPINVGSQSSSQVGNARQNQQQAISLRQIPVRRLLQDSQREFVCIELRDQIEPKWSSSSSSSGRQSGALEHEPKQARSSYDSFITFGDNSQPIETASDLFVLSISYNKTSLMASDGGGGGSAGNTDELGINLVQYADLYGPTNTQGESEPLKSILFSQFERYNARRLIPCFDEPKFKAKFQLNLVHEQHHQVLFNAPKRERVSYTSDGSLQMSVFEWTPIPICTYLVSILVCDALNIKSLATRLTTNVNMQPPPYLSTNNELTSTNRQLDESGYRSTLQRSKHLQIQLLAQNEQLSQAEFASQLVQKLVRFYQLYLDQEYPVDKLDLVAIPATGAGGSHQSATMRDTVESLGLIWFKSQNLLVDPNLISQLAIEQVSSIVAHQIAHQFLGNLVTIQRWSDWPLFEALCQYLEAIALRSVEPDWNLDEQYLVGSIQDAILANDRPTLLSNSDARVSTSFPLNRSSAIIHMLMLNLLPSEEARAKLLRKCLELHRTSSMSSHQFWHIFKQQQLLEDGQSNVFGSSHKRLSSLIRKHSMGSKPVASGDNEDLYSSSSGGIRAAFKHPSDVDQLEDLSLAYDAWLAKPGIALLSVSIQRDRLQISQEALSTACCWSSSMIHDRPGVLSNGQEEASSFELDQTGSSTNNLTGDQTWPIPLMFLSKFNPKTARFFWMRDVQIDLPFNRAPLLQPDNQDSYFPSLDFKRDRQLSFWFKLNINQSSLVRVNYDERNWEALTDLLARSHYSNHLLNPLDRANLIDDALTLMRCGKLAVGLAMNLTMYLEVGERDYAPWMATLRNLDQLQVLLNQNPLWNHFVLKLIRPIGSVVGWKDDGPHLMRKLRRHLFGVALQHGDEKIINKAKQEFKVWYKNNRFVVPNLQELVYVAGVKYGDQQEWLHCWQKYQQLVAPTKLNSTSSSNRNIGGDHSNEPEIEGDKLQLLTALASTPNIWLLEQFLNYSMDPNKIEPNHVVHVVRALGKNAIARLYLWRFVRLNWFNLLDRFVIEYDIQSGKPLGKNLGVVETMVVESTRHFASNLDYEEVRLFFDSRRAGLPASVIIAVEQSLRNIRSNIYWREHVEPKLARWLSQVVPQ